jgi:hypothetical protein
VPVEERADRRLGLVDLGMQRLILGPQAMSQEKNTTVPFRRTGDHEFGAVNLAAFNGEIDTEDAEAGTKDQSQKGQQRMNPESHGGN